MVNSPLASAGGIGFTLKQVTVKEINSNNGIALCVDTEGAYVEVMTWLRRVLLQPQPGDTWLIDRQLGTWTFTAIVSAAFPTADGPWTALTMQNGWVASTVAGDGPPVARVTASGWVEVAGVVKPGTMPAQGVELTVAQLPTGVQAPVYNGWLTAPCNYTTTTAGEYVRAAVRTDGTVTIKLPFTMSPGWIDLTGLRARAA